VDGIQLEVQRNVHIPLMLSAGAAVFPHDGDCYEALLAAADSRMYRDKSERRATRSCVRPAAEESRGLRSRAAV